jgi:dTDP-glucose 4,6-dehydratase
MILEEMGLSEDRLEYVKDRAGHDRRYAINHDKITRELGWKPEITLEEGLKETITWFQENKDWWRAVKDGSYQEYYEKQYIKR